MAVSTTVARGLGSTATCPSSGGSAAIPLTSDEGSARAGTKVSSTTKERLASMVSRVKIWGMAWGSVTR